MKKSDQPISIIGVLFALSIAFWGHNMVRYIQQEMPRRGYALTADDIKTLDQNEDVKEVYNLPKLTELLETKPLLVTGEYFEAWLKEVERKQGPATGEEQSTATGEKQLTVAERERLAAAKTWLTKQREVSWVTKQRAARKAVMAKAAILMRPRAERSAPLRTDSIEVLFSILTILAGVAFLADIACIMWWYGRYIYIIQPTPTLSTHFIDFGICAAFNLAATAWTDPRVFLTATMGGAGLLLWRFFLLHRSPEASKTDINILKSAWHWMTIAAVASFLAISAGAVAILLFEGRGADTYKRGFYPVMLLALSAIGICLTVKFANRIRKSADMHENLHRHFTPMELHWPEDLKDDDDAKQRLTDPARSGLDRFRNMFSVLGVEHDRLISRVHSEADLRVQSYILAIPSWKSSKNSKANPTAEGGPVARPDEVNGAEIERKAFIVALSHWLDDLLDGRDEIRVYRESKNWADSVSGLDLRENRRMFDQFYRSIVVDYTDPAFYDALVDGIEKSVVLRANLPYLYFGLNRVAIGSALFSPRVPYKARRTMLRSHGSMLGQLVASEYKGQRGEWFKSLTELLSEMQVREDRLGHYLLGLTTKTSQEMGMASERRPVEFALSVLYSLLYAPLLYFHDIADEVEVGEMAALETFVVDYEAVIPWIRTVRGLITDTKDGTNGAPVDDLYDSRALQIKMAFRCFETHLPQVGNEQLVEVYLGKDEADRRRNASP